MNEQHKNQVIIDGMEVPIEGERNLLELIRKADIELPTFCYHSYLSVYGACRLCVVEIEGRGIQASCSIVPEHGMKVKTATEMVRKIRKINLELILANHDIDCPSCSRSNNCKLQDLSRRLGISSPRFEKTNRRLPIDNHGWSIVHDPNKCVLCGDCVRVCKEIQTVGAIDFTRRGAATVVAPAFGKSLADVECVNCGQCVAACPVGALTPKTETNEVWKALHDPQKVVVAQVAPAVRVAIGEEFGLEAGTISTGQMVAALKRLGFDYVFDTSFAADLTVVEEANEFLQRKNNGGTLPMFTSCCPAWVKFSEQYYSELLPHLSSCKSPQQMFGSVAKSILPQQLGIAPENLVVVSVMPCTAKKYEAKRPEFYTDNRPDVDHVLTTEGLSRMIAETGIQFNKLTPMSFDLPLGFKTGAGIIFGNSGGVSEAVLRYAYEKITGEKLANVEFHAVRGEEGIREAVIQCGEQILRLAVVHSLGNARELARRVKRGEAHYDLIEIMACPGGCVNGGGQPVNYDPEYRRKRTRGLYNVDRSLQLHKPQDNPFIQELYDKHLEAPGSHKSHSMLHTRYHARKKVDEKSLTLRSSELHKIEVCVCVGTNCYRKGAQDLLRSLLRYVSENKLSDIVGIKDQKEVCDVKATFCFERCERGPVVRINKQIIEYATFDKCKTAILHEVEKLVPAAKTE